MPDEHGNFKVMIAVPSRDVWKSDFGMSLAMMVGGTMQSGAPISLILNNAKGASLCQNRINLCKRAIEVGCDYILFLDDDMRIPADTLIRLVHAQKDVIGANCARREMPPAPTAQGFDREMVYTTKESTGVQEVRSVGTGVLLIKLDILQSIPQPWFEEDVMKGIGEDVNFCLKAREKKFKIFIDHDVSKGVYHIGEMEYHHSQMNKWSPEENAQ